MRVAQSVFGVFHHFDLARELEARSSLGTVYSTWPWARLKREGIPREKVKTFPWLHLPEMVVNRSLDWPWMGNQLGYANALAFDRWTNRRLLCSEPPDALIAISGSSLSAGQGLQQRGGRFVCDRGSSHQRYQDLLLEEENRRWSIETTQGDIRDTIREEEIYSVADIISVPSTFAARSFVEMGVPADKLAVIPYGVRLERFRKIAPTPDIRERFEVVFAGHVSLRKGIPYLLQAFASVKHTIKRLRIVGSVSQEMKSILHRFSLDSVEFVGVVSQDELVTIMSTSHVLVLPSVEDGFGLVLGQALACGCPIIASRNTGAADLIIDGQEGFIVPIRDPESITGCFERLICSPTLQASMAKAALKCVLRLDGWKHYGDMWESLLMKLIARK